MPLDPAHTLGLAVSLVMSQLSFIILIPFSSLSNDLRSKLDDMDYKRGSQNLFICIRSFRRSSNIEQSLHFFSFPADVLWGSFELQRTSAGRLAFFKTGLTSLLALILSVGQALAYYATIILSIIAWQKHRALNASILAIFLYH